MRSGGQNFRAWHPAVHLAISETAPQLRPSSSGDNDLSSLHPHHPSVKRPRGHGCSPTLCAHLLTSCLPGGSPVWWCTCPELEPAQQHSDCPPSPFRCHRMGGWQALQKLGRRGTRQREGWPLLYYWPNLGKLWERVWCSRTHQRPVDTPPPAHTPLGLQGSCA